MRRVHGENKFEASKNTGKSPSPDIIPFTTSMPIAGPSLKNAYPSL